MHVHLKGKIPVITDSKSGVDVIKNPGVTKHTTHWMRWLHWARELVLHRVIDMYLVGTDHQMADDKTKAVDFAKAARCRSFQLNCRESPSAPSDEDAFMVTEEESSAEELAAASDERRRLERDNNLAEKEYSDRVEAQKAQRRHAYAAHIASIQRDNNLADKAYSDRVEAAKRMATELDLSSIEADDGLT